MKNALVQFAQFEYRLQPLQDGLPGMLMDQRTGWSKIANDWVEHGSSKQMPHDLAR